MNPNAPDDVDDLASALIDGLLDDEQAAAAQRDPAVASRADEMRAARQALRSVPPVDSEQSEKAITAALRHGPSAPTDGVRSMAGRRTPWLAAAAVLVVLLAIGGALATWAASSSDETASSGGDSGAPEEQLEAADEEAAADEGDVAAEEDAGAEAAPAPGDDDAATDEAARAPTTTGAAADGGTDLGSVGSIDELAARARAALDGSRPDQGGGADGTAGPGCPVPPAVERAGGPELRGQATLDGERLDVWVYDDGGTLRLLAIDASCAEVANQALDG